MRLGRLLSVVCLAGLLAACAGPRPFRVVSGDGAVECNVGTANKDDRCFRRSPETSSKPAYTLHFVEIDDQGWLYPDVPEMGSAHTQIDRAIDDIAQKLDRRDVSVLVYVHGWKHNAAHDDRDVQRFRQMLSDASMLERGERTVVGIYVGWRGASLAASNPLSNLTFWTRKNVALHVSEGAARELFARLRALRDRKNTPDRALTPDALQKFMQHPPMRTVIIGHSFGGWVVFSALSPGVMEMLARPVESSAGPAASTVWRSARIRQAADLILLVNPAFEASRYEPVHDFAQRHKLPRYEPPLLVMVTSEADGATRQAFPLGRIVNTAFERPFTSELQGQATTRTPGFVDLFVTHQLTFSEAAAAACPSWKDSPDKRDTGDAYVPPTELEDARRARMISNGTAELGRHGEWQAYRDNQRGALPPNWSWGYCGAAAIRHVQGSPMALVWNVKTDGILVQNHSDIMGESLHAFFRQLYLDLSE